MKASLATLEGLKRALTVKLPIETFRQKSDKILQKIAPTVAVNGFRKGKVPLSVLHQQFGERASSEAVNEIVNETLGDALAQVKLTPAEQPAITKVDLKDEDNFSYTVEFEVYPQINVADFAKLNIAQSTVEITQADEDKTLEKLIEQSTEYKAVKRKSKKGDRVRIDFNGTVDGKVFEGGKATNFELILGSGSMIAGFEDRLTGTLAGKTLNLDLTFPKDYQITKLAGKAVNFMVTLIEVAAPKVPTLNAEFAKKLGESSINTLKKGIKERMHVEANNRLENQNKEAIFNALLAANDFDAPQSSIDNEAQNLLQEMEARMQEYDTPQSNGSLPASTFNPEAQRRVKLGLLVAQIARDNKLTASTAQIEEKIKEMAQRYGENVQQMLDYYTKDAARRSSIELLVVEKMVQQLILDKARVSTNSKTFQAVTQQRANI